MALQAPAPRKGPGKMALVPGSASSSQARARRATVPLPASAVMQLLRQALSLQKDRHRVSSHGSPERPFRGIALAVSVLQADLPDLPDEGHLHHLILSSWLDTP